MDLHVGARPCRPDPAVELAEVEGHASDTHRCRVARHVDAAESLLVEATHPVRVVAVNRDRADPGGLRGHGQHSCGTARRVRDIPTTQGRSSIDPWTLSRISDIIVRMFEDRLEGALGNACALADLAADTESDVRQLGCRKLRVAAAWADAHSDVDHPDGGMLVERVLPFGPAGCPPVAETCTGSLALAFRTSTQSAKGWITDALTVRHRLPLLWERVLAGDVYAWKAREIARATAHLNVFTARIVDKLLHDQVELVAWTRFQRILDATLLQVDPATYGERQAKAAAQRDVKATQSSDGLRTLVARGTSGDVTMFLALIDAIAQALADEGDEDPYPVRKSKAIGIAAYPDRAQDLLSRGRHREDPTKDP